MTDDPEPKKETPLSSVLSRAQRIADDLDLTVVERWKSAQEGRKAVGHLPVTIPREILHAAGVLPVGIIGGGDQVEIIRGDAYFQSYICHLPRSVVELEVSGRLSSLDGMIFPSICDVVRNLTGVWQLLFPHKYARYLDLPQNCVSSLGGSWYASELATLLMEMGTLAGTHPTDDALRASIDAYNHLRRRMRRLSVMRAAEPWRVPASEVHLLTRAGLVLPVEDFIRLLDDYLAAVQEEDRKPYDFVRVVLAGAFCEQPPLDLIRTLERAGCYVVDDDCLLVHRWPEDPIPTEGDPLTALVDAYLGCGREQATRFAPDGEEKGAWLVNRVKELGADGVVFAAPSFCDPALLDRPLQQSAVKAAGVPATAFKYAENTGQFQVIREQTGAFSDSIRLWPAS
jgi:benzoyl-CoA reductase subunit C